MTIRVMRVLEYEYEDVDTMITDMGHWQLGANSVRRPNKNLTIRSATLPVAKFFEVAAREDNGGSTEQTTGEDNTPRH